MEIVNLRLPAEKTRLIPIYIKKNLFREIPVFLKGKKLGFEYLILTDEKVKKLYGLKLIEGMKKASLKTLLISLPPSEKTKNLDTAKKVLEQMASSGLKRDSCIITLGGGVIGDLGGFIASIFMRGINLVHIPTTLLSMIDSSLGSKTGVDLQTGKNLVGTFYDPKAIFIDPLFLRSLPSSEFRNGLSEMIKHAVIASPSLFRNLEKVAKKLRPEETNLLEKLISENIRIKKKVIEADPSEDIGLVSAKKMSRMFLNYGHTIGHALEKVTNYEIPHGEAVSIGMCLENVIAVKKGFLKVETALRIKNLLKTLGLSTSLPSSLSLREIDRALKADKKIVGGKIYFALPAKIGEMRLFAL